MLFFTELARRHLPNSQPLPNALAPGQVGVTRATDHAVYVISKLCPDASAVEAAKLRRNAWVLAVGQSEGAALSIAIAFILYFSLHL